MYIAGSSFAGSWCFVFHVQGARRFMVLTVTVGHGVCIRRCCSVPAFTDPQNATVSPATVSKDVDLLGAAGLTSTMTRKEEPNGDGLHLVTSCDWERWPPP